MAPPEASFVGAKAGNLRRTRRKSGIKRPPGSADAHGAPLGEEEVCLTKECLGCPKDETFCIPDEVLAAPIAL